MGKNGKGNQCDLCDSRTVRTAFYDLVRSEQTVNVTNYQQPDPIVKEAKLHFVRRLHRVADNQGWPGEVIQRLVNGLDSLVSFEIDEQCFTTTGQLVKTTHARFSHSLKVINPDLGSIKVLVSLNKQFRNNLELIDSARSTSVTPLPVPSSPNVRQVQA